MHESRPGGPRRLPGPGAQVGRARSGTVLDVKVAIPTELVRGESRVAVTPDTVAKLTAAGAEVVVEAGAGERAHLGDLALAEAGATIAPTAAACWEAAAVICKVQPPTAAEVERVPKGAVLISFLPLSTPADVVRQLAAREVTAFSFEQIPRISRAQSMDALSSQASLAGYKAVLVAAERLPKILPLQMTAAGTIPPARVLVMGAGVAGLQAIATARRLGAVVEATDVRAAAQDEVRSLGATFVEMPLPPQEGSGGYAAAQSDEFLQRQREIVAARVAAADIVITTAAIPGRRAPVLVTRAMAQGMRPGSVIVDLAADTGGNCELTSPGEEVSVGGVTVVGWRNMAATVPTTASQVLARNAANLLLLLVHEGALTPDFDDEVVGQSCVLRAGQVVEPRWRAQLEEAAAP